MTVAAAEIRAPRAEIALSCMLRRHIGSPIPSADAERRPARHVRPQPAPADAGRDRRLRPAQPRHAPQRPRPRPAPRSARTSTRCASSACPSRCCAGCTRWRSTRADAPPALSPAARPRSTRSAPRARRRHEQERQHLTAGLPGSASAPTSSACSSTSRAIAWPDAGTMTSRGPGGEHVGDVEAARAPQRRRHALLQQHALDELGLGLVGGADDAHERALGVLRLDLARALRGQRASSRPSPESREDERHRGSRGRSARRPDAARRSSGRRARRRVT